ncbi:MAG TPA: sodium:solute symporter family protein [Candidatus Paceibacterota bacterium]|nr:sodium:solute symporter family protein [Candidatus Paceibacterota bacterium]
MLLLFVALYMLITIPVSIYAAHRVHSTKDYVLAGRHLPFAMALATVFATWFGSDSVLGAGTAFAEGGFLNVMVDPFGAGLCLILIGLFFVPKLYNLNHLTIGDYFEERYGRTVATLLSIAIIITYFGWTAAQFVAIGIVLNMLLGVPLALGMALAALIVLIYTVVGGMWSVSLNDTIQMGMIIVGLVAVCAEVIWKFGFTDILASAPPEYYEMTPGAAGSMKDWLYYAAALMTLGLGSIPQQDVYQRAMSAKSLKVSQWASIVGGLMYFVVVMMPLFLGLAARMLFPELLTEGADSQQLLPSLILGYISFPTQVLFFGALIAAIMSTASAAILAPATLFAENVVRPFYSEMSDHLKLKLIRGSIVAVALIALVIAIQEGSIYEIVGASYSITLVAAFVPMAVGLYFKKANAMGAMLAIFFGALSWQYIEHFGGEDPMIPSIIVGLACSIAGMVIGTMLGRFVRREEVREG